MHGFCTVYGTCFPATLILEASRWWWEWMHHYASVDHFQDLYVDMKWEINTSALHVEKLFFINNIGLHAQRYNCYIGLCLLLTVLASFHLNLCGNVT